MGNYPMPAYHFIVEWGGSRIGFESVSGLNIHVSVSSYREGSNPDYSDRKMPGMISYSNIILRREILKGDNEFFHWLNTQSMNTIERRDVLITLLDFKHEPVVIWKLKNAFPVRYSGPLLKSEDSSIAYEELELAHEGMKVENSP